MNTGADNSLKGRQEFTAVNDAATEASKDKHNLQSRTQFAANTFVAIDEQTSNLEQENLDAAFAPAQTKRKRSRLLVLVVLLLCAVVGVETYLSLRAALAQSVWLFALYGSTLVALVAFAGRALWSEFKKLRRLRHTLAWQETGDRLRLSMQSGEAAPVIRQLAQGFGDDKDAEGKKRTLVAIQQMALSQYYAKATADHNDAEQVQLFEIEVLYPLDKQAQSIVSRYALEAATLLAASPLAVMDMAIILWRNQKLLNDIAACYGIELGYWSRIRLLKTIVLNVIYAGTTEIITDLGSQLLSMEMTGKLSARLAQGVGGGLLTARLGYQAMALCRPLAFAPEHKPKLSRVHKDLLIELKRIFTDKQDSGLNAETITQAEKVKR
ncbi:TIGR01620 family protein [Shewanella sp. SNU WT4]|uniref:TIGR01620 family protein n=1 Tax=Shewanella sp. SNU WT4 TaxID=2590015 RepID=UPI00112D5817|nr:TIGR01620 family protein [Shewanella sp. SNU WT4]QDF66684.1 TIGR01620 family protein [Shewanella sp. SNU WT4]